MWLPRTVVPLAAALCLALFLPTSAWAGESDLLAAMDEDMATFDEEDEEVEGQEANQDGDILPSEDSQATYGQNEGEADVPAQAGTVLSYTLSGVAVGAIVGTSIWILSGREISLWIIPQFAAGGAIIGAGVGALVVLGADREPLAQPGFDIDPAEPAGWNERQIPQRFEVQILQVNF